MGEFSRYFELLEIPEGASTEEIKKAFRDLAQVWHPDKFEHNPRLRDKAELKFKELNAAYSILVEGYRSGTIRSSSAPRSKSSNETNTHASSESAKASGKTESKQQPPPETKQESPRAEAYGLQNETNPGCATTFAVSVILLLVLLIVSSGQKSDPLNPSANSYTVARPVLTATQLRHAKRAEIERRVALKDSEFERLGLWYKSGVLLSEQQDYNNALARARKEEEEIEKLIHEYNRTAK